MFVFDLLYVDGEALVALPLRERRQRLQRALPNLRPGHVQIAESTEFEPAAFTGSTAAAVAAAAAAARAGSADGMEQTALAAEAVPMNATGQRSGKPPEPAGKPAGEDADGLAAEAVLAVASPPAAQSAGGATQAGQSIEASQAADRPSPSDAAAGAELVPASGLQALEARIQVRLTDHAQCPRKDQESSACADPQVWQAMHCTLDVLPCDRASGQGQGLRRIQDCLVGSRMLLHSSRSVQAKRHRWMHGLVKVGVCTCRTTCWSPLPPALRG